MVIATPRRAQSYGATLLKGRRRCFLPPYSPDFNPIELSFAKLKASAKPAARTTRSGRSSVRVCRASPPPNAATTSAAAERHEKRSIEADAGEQVHGPKLLPDGETLLFAVTTASSATRWDEAVLVVQRLEGGERKVVWTGGSDAHYVPTGHLCLRRAAH